MYVSDFEGGLVMWVGFDSMYDPVLVCEGWICRQIAVNLFPYQLPAFLNEHVTTNHAVDTA